MYRQLQILLWNAKSIPTKLNQYSKMQIRSININGYNQRIFRYVNFIIPCIYISSTGKLICYFNKFILLEFAIFTIKQRLAKDFITRGFHRTLIPTCIFMISFKSNIYSERVSNLTVHVLITTAKYAF